MVSLHVSNKKKVFQVFQCIENEKFQKEKKSLNEAEEIFGIIMAENIPKLVTDTGPQIQEAQRILSSIPKMKTKQQEENPSRQIIFKWK